MRSHDAKCLFRIDLVRDQARDRVVRARNVRQQLRAGRVVKRARVGHLPARFGIDHGAIENDFTRLASLQFVDGTVLADDRFDANVFRAYIAIKILLGLEVLRNLGKRRIRRILVRAFPRRPGARPLLLHRLVESCPIEHRILCLDTRPDEIRGKPYVSYRGERLSRSVVRAGP